MEGGALVAGFFPLKWVIGGLFIGIYLYFHSARQRRSGHMQNFKFYFLFIIFLFLAYICLYLLIDRTWTDVFPYW